MKNLLIISLILFASCQKTEQDAIKPVSVPIGDDALKLKSTRTAAEILEYNQLVIRNTNVIASAKGGKPPTNPCGGKGNKPCPETPPTPIPTPTPQPVDTTGYAIVYVDIDGEDLSLDNNWNGQIQQALPASEVIDWAEVKRIFDINYAAYRVVLTFDLDVYLAANPLRRAWLIVTPSSFIGGYSGMAYIGSMFSGINPNTGKGVPGFVFSNVCGNDGWIIGQIVSHEAAHTIGASHTKTYVSSTDCTVKEAYAPGVVTGNPTTQARFVDALWGAASPCRYNGYAYNISDVKILTDNLGAK